MGSVVYNGAYEQHAVMGAHVTTDGTITYDDPKQRYVCMSRELFEQMLYGLQPEWLAAREDPEP